LFHLNIKLKSNFLGKESLKNHITGLLNNIFPERVKYCFTLNENICLEMHGFKTVQKWLTMHII
jgi:hypothetical protein